MKTKKIALALIFTTIISSYTIAQLKPDILNFEPFIWKSDQPDCWYYL